MLSTRTKAVALPRDRYSTMPIVPMQTSASLLRDLVDPLDADPGAPLREMITPTLSRDVGEISSEIPKSYHNPSSSRDKLHELTNEISKSYLIPSSSRYKHHEPTSSDLPRDDVLPRDGQSSKISVDQPADNQPCNVNPHSDLMSCDPIIAQVEPIIDSSITNLDSKSIDEIDDITHDLNIKSIIPTKPND